MGKKEKLKIEIIENLPIIDCHCHIPGTFPPEELNTKSVDMNDLALESSEYQLREFYKHNGEMVITSSLDWESTILINDFIEKHKDIKLGWTAGWAPQTITYTENKKHELEFNKWLNWMHNNSEKILAIGEIGLDFYHAKTLEARKKQILFLNRIISELKELNKPFVLHVRNASRRSIDKEHPNHDFNELDGANKQILKILEKYNIEPTRVMWHCFSGPKEWGKILADKGYFLSVPSSAFGQRRWRIPTKDVSIDKLLTETDAPFQHPYHFGAPNTPINVKYSIAAIAYTHNLTQLDVANKILHNAKKFFGF